LTRRKRKIVIIVAVTLGLHVPPGGTLAQGSEGIENKRGFFALPVELDVDRGAANGDAGILRLSPLYTFPVFENWKLVHMTIITMADAPSGTPVFPGSPDSGNNTGLADILHTTFYTPASDGKFLWGLGVMLGMPTATANGLGSKKWTAGPALRATYRTELWNLGIVAGQRWSYAGSGNRPDVNQLMIRGAIRRELSNHWYFVSAPIIVADWDRSGERWLVPVGGGLGRGFRMGENPWAVSVQAYYNAIRPDGSPDWVVRLGVISAIPFGD
jgi:hypothetical protein